MLKHLVSALAVVFLVGCATPATQQAMSISVSDAPTKLNGHLKGQVTVGEVIGGEETNPMWVSKVDAQNFKAALDKSIAVAGYKAGAASAAAYKVDANLQKLDQPLFGFTYDVSSTVLYTVAKGDAKVQFPVTATGTATTSDAFIAGERLRIASERSIKENIKLFLQQLGDRISW